MFDTNQILVDEWERVMSFPKFARLNRSGLPYLKVPPEQLVPPSKHAQMLKDRKWRQRQAYALAISQIYKFYSSTTTSRF